jgi:uncharacterized protein (TIGR02145 family)
MKLPFQIRLFVIFGLLLLCAAGCKKDKDNSNSGTVKDIDGNTYKTVKIGDQLWMAENLKTTKYKDGTPIPNETDDSYWSSLSTGVYCWYNNDYSTYGSVYGALYNWFSVETGNLCPTGWHVPTDAEWTILTDFLGGDSVAGGKLKSTGTIEAASGLWHKPNTGATNSSGFTALPGGYRGDYNGNFSDVGSYGNWWSSTAYSTTHAWYRVLYYYDSDVYRSNDGKKDGFSVRCVRD